MLPTLIGFFVLIKSTYISLRRKSVISRVLTIIILLLTALSETILYQIFFQGGWASFVPHVMIGLSLVLFALQLVFTRQKTIVEKK